MLLKLRTMATWPLGLRGPISPGRRVHPLASAASLPHRYPPSVYLQETEFDFDGFERAEGDRPWDASLLRLGARGHRMRGRTKHLPLADLWEAEGPGDKRLPPPELDDFPKEALASLSGAWAILRAFSWQVKLSPFTLEQLASAFAVGGSSPCLGMAGPPAGLADG